MSFDFNSFRRLLYQNALDDAINMLGRQGPAGYKTIADRIGVQLSAWRNSLGWRPFHHKKKSRYHEKIVHNLYQSGLAASTGGQPPDLISVHPWRNLSISYLSVLVILASGFYFITHKSPCPGLDHKKDLTIIIDKFGSLNEPLLQRFGLGGETFEKQIEGALSLQNIDVKVYPVKVANKDQAKLRCNECNANMVIWGNVEYGDSIRAYLYHYLNNENYDSYLLSDGLLNVEEHYVNIFGLRTGQWIGKVECLVKLFQGLLQKEKFQTSTDPKIRAEALLSANRLFSDLSTCANDDSLKIFALQCKAWSELKMDDKEKALETFNDILKVDPANSLALNNSGVLFLEQNDNLHAQMQFEKILEKNDVPSIRIANAEALSKLNRGEEAKKEIEHVEKSNDYHARKEMYDRKIRTIPTASLQPNPGLSAVSPSLSLSSITTQFNGGDSDKAIKNLDILVANKDADFSKEDLIIMSEIYKNAGATGKARMLNSKAESMGAITPAQATTISKLVKHRVNHQ